MNQRGTDARGTKISSPSQHRERPSGMRCVELGRLSARQLQRSAEGARPKHTAAAGVEESECEKKDCFSLKVSPNRCFSVSIVHI